MHCLNHLEIHRIIKHLTGVDAFKNIYMIHSLLIKLPDLLKRNLPITCIHFQSVWHRLQLLDFQTLELDEV